MGKGGAKLAVLIDADNAEPSIIENLLLEISVYGVASVKRIYGDWTNPNLKRWKEVLLNFAIQPIQQFRYTIGKNSTDSAMIIDAMDLLYTENLDGFCLISSDSDFTRLAVRIRENGTLVYGFGEQKTPKSFVAACDYFIYTEALRVEDTSVITTKDLIVNLKSDSNLISLLRGAVHFSADDTGWAYLGNVGKNLASQIPDFDPRQYGYKKLGDLVRAIDIFELEVRGADDSSAKSVYVRDCNSFEENEDLNLLECDEAAL